MGSHGAIGVLLVALLAACSGNPNYLPVPTFPDSGSAAGLAQAAAPGELLNECERVLPVADVVALLGLPLESVAVHSTVGVPEPSVGRLQRLVCRYSGVAGRFGDAALLELNIGRYVDDPAAAKQWRLNAAIEDGARRDVPLGTAQAIIIERPAESLLTVLDQTRTLMVILPVRAPRPPGRSPSDTLVDLALRILATITPVESPRRESASAG